MHSKGQGIFAISFLVKSFTFLFKYVKILLVDDMILLAVTFTETIFSFLAFGDKEMFNKLKELIVQMIKFGGVGVICFLIDFAVLHVLTDYVHLHYLLSAAIAFLVSVIANYILSIRFVFKVNPDNNKVRVFAVFVISSAVGLLLTELLMWLGVDILHINYMITKIAATAVVMVYNFITRKIFLER